MTSHGNHFIMKTNMFLVYNIIKYTILIKMQTNIVGYRKTKKNKD